MNDNQRQRQIAEAEELLGDRLGQAGFAQGLFFGRYLNHRLRPYPEPAADAETIRAAEELRAFCHERIDPAAIDRAADIPRDVIEGLGRLGILGACLPTACGGRGMSQTAYCRLVEILGGHCGSTALFVNAHHSIGPRAIVLFGTPEQQVAWLPKLASGEWLSAFALTEPEAGSDAANVRTTAAPTADGKGFLLNGQKRWITNGGIAQVLTVMARTPATGAADGKVTAFIVTPDMPGFEVVEARMEKCGVRGTATARLAFHDMFVPKANILGREGQGLKVALTVLDFGRTTFGASCTGAARFCLEHAVRHAATRVQFGQPLATFDLVRQKLAAMKAGVLAMHAATYQTAALIDAGEGDYMLETAILKIFSTEELWRIINDTIQIYGGKAYFTDEPFERMMRDARINLIGEGANDVLRAFTALVGMREVGLELKAVLDALGKPLANLGRLAGFAGKRLEGLFRAPEVHIHAAELEPEAAHLGRLAAYFGSQVERLLRIHRESIVERQHQQGRIANAVIELYTSACVLKRLDSAQAATANHGPSRSETLLVGRYYLRAAERRIRRALAGLWDNDDPLVDQVAAV